MGTTIAVFQILGIFSSFMHLLNNFVIAKINDSLLDKNFKILGCISSGPMLLLTSSLDNNTLTSSADIDRSHIMLFISLLL